MWLGDTDSAPVQRSSPKQGVDSPVEDKERARRSLETDLRRWWREECEEWDTRVVGGDMAHEDLWAGMPVGDSKTVARMAPLFEKHLGIPLDVRRIRPGGYGSIDEMIRHLVWDEDG